MATQHGNRSYFQLLLQPFRAQLLKDLAAERGDSSHGFGEGFNLLRVREGVACFCLQGGLMLRIRRVGKSQ